MDPHWEALFGLVSVAILFLPLFLVMFGGINGTRELQAAARERRIAAYRRSPESQLLKLT